MIWQRSPVAVAISCPEEVLSFSLSEWDQLIRQAKSMGLLGAIEGRLDQFGLLEQVPSVARPHLQAARNIARSHERVIRWEVYCLQKAIANVQKEITLLKGAAYILCGLPNARGRLLSDVDILVP